MSGMKMPTSPSSASKAFSSTPLKYRSRSVEEDLVSSDEDTYSLLSPIYHDSYDSEEELAAPCQPQHQSDTLGPQGQEPRPTSSVSCELPRRSPVGRAEPKAGGADVSASLSAWEAWLVSKARDQRLRLEKRAEEDRLQREKEEQEEKEQDQKRLLVEEKIQEWLKMKREQEKQEKALRDSREQQEVTRQQEAQEEMERRAKKKYREWLRKKNEEKAHQEQKDKEETNRKEQQEKERRNRAEEKFKEWLTAAKEKNRTNPKSPGFPGSPYDKAYPAPSFYNPIPWKPIHVPPTDTPPKKNGSRKKGQGQPRQLSSSRTPCRPRDSMSTSQLLHRR